MGGLYTFQGLPLSISIQNFPPKHPCFPPDRKPHEKAINSHQNHRRVVKLFHSPMLIWNQQLENPFVSQPSPSSLLIPNAASVRPISSLVCKSCSLVASALRGNYIRMVPRTSMCFCSFPRGRKLKIHVLSILEGSIATSRRRRIRSKRFNTC